MAQKQIAPTTTMIRMPIRIVIMPISTAPHDAKVSIFGLYRRVNIEKLQQATSAWIRRRQ
jgi:hypothetical protein